MAMTMERGDRITVDPVRCRGHGICALLAPDHIDLDRWGYPVVDAATLTTRRDRRRARRAARACPQRALHVQAAP
jgi:ferredoxin